MRFDAYNGRFPALEHCTPSYIRYEAPQNGSQVAVVGMGRYNLDYTNLTRRMDALHELLREQLGVAVTVEPGFVRDTLVDILELAYRVTCPGEFTDEMQATMADLFRPEHSKVVFARMEYVASPDGSALRSRLRPSAADDELLATTCRGLGERLDELPEPGYHVRVEPGPNGGHDILTTFDAHWSVIEAKHVIWQLKRDTRLYIILEGEAQQVTAL
jgi:hypothetical protein